jgi:hypothetical protein
MAIGTRYTLRTSDFEHLLLCVQAAEAKFNNSLAGDEAALAEAISATFRMFHMLAEILAEQEAA